MFCAQGILLALLERETSGQGQLVQTSLLEAQIQMLDFQAARYLMDGEVPKQAGNDHPTSIPTGVFPTADGHINIAVAASRISSLTKNFGPRANSLYRSEEHTSELQSLMRTSYAGFCLKKKTQ